MKRLMHDIRPDPNLVRPMNTAPITDQAIVPNGGMVIRTDTVLQPGVYLLPEGIIIDGDNVTLDGNGATIVGQGRRGAGITVVGRSKVTIRNVRIRDFYHGIVVRNGQQITIDRNDITSTAEVEQHTIFLNIWTAVEDAYGAGILFDNVTDSNVIGNELSHQMNGLLTYNCRRLNVRRNNASYCSGFGFHLFETSDSVWEDNWADYCNRYEPRDPDQPVIGVGSVGHMGADATGFLIVHNSCNNIFRRNFARCGGDGFFLAGRSPSGADVGCNDNLFEENDGSLSPNIAFEATFSSGNIFRNNWADRCNFGFWLGYSTRNVIEGNRMLYNRQAGLAVEHGVECEVRNNDFQSNGHGILLWTKYVKMFYDDETCNRTSRDWTIEHNRFLRNDFGIAIRVDRDHGIRPVPEEDANLDDMRPKNHAIRHNDIQDNRVGIHLHGADGTVIEKNKINKNVEVDIRRDDDRDTTLGHNLGLRGAYL